jgi:hypothetical protein
MHKIFCFVFLVENVAYQKDVWANIRKPMSGEKQQRHNSRNSIVRTRKYISLIQEGHPSLAVDGNEDNALHNCAIMDNYYTDKPTLIIDLGQLTSVGGIVLKTWQGKGQDTNFAYRDYMYGLDRLSVFVDKRPYNNQHLNHINSQSASHLIAEDLSSNNASTIMAMNGSIVVRESQYAMNLGTSVNMPRVKLNEQNMCNFVTRNNYAVFTPSIHLQCSKPLTGRYVYVQADGRSNRWSRLFSAVVCEAQVYEL